jgi:hypothetical protein
MIKRHDDEGNLDVDYRLSVYEISGILEEFAMNIDF